ncbi:hypothetical protein FAZ19_17445 [Sphingobacterium alkalisoli]|uniref:Membrane or secreted protein n=1 Tax=Sphingobacterium alkalisoli TaxID=1874115 RepID=A0A4U0GW66_9SPHI|nr:hypothetical protein [Sphingobacterium alkalisoli]TJY63371.1 hypothetical protein FAZ19_17445 [Sphingobacterium alkalisoli]GGH25635.1 hypothetical protein GCM10011418_34340 [Sphingobacterium alkalisoli]
MKSLTIIIIGICIFFASPASSQPSSPLNGVYHTKVSGTNTLWLFSDGYSSQIVYKDTEYLFTKGGPYKYNGETLSIIVEYSDNDSSEVGKTQDIQMFLEGSNLKSPEGVVFKKQPTKTQELDGVWRISGRKQGDEINIIQRGDRKTIKILIDGYFQWVAINPSVKGFYGTGGGHYTHKDQQYTEHILFFSRDNSRVGNYLNFKGEIKDDSWHHSGNSSKGDPIYEIWSSE